MDKDHPSPKAAPPLELTLGETPGAGDVSKTDPRVLEARRRDDILKRKLAELRKRDANEYPSF